MAKSTEKSAAEPVLKVRASDIPETANTSAPAEKTALAMYSIEDLANAEKALDADKIIIKTALRKDGKDMYSLAEAKKIVTKFKNKEVKI